MFFNLKEMGVPLVACLGTEAEGLRDCLLTRLDSSTEDLWVKVAILRLLTIATPLQPGLIRLFLTPPSPLLDTLVNLLQQHKEVSFTKIRGIKFCQNLKIFKFILKIFYMEVFKHL